MTLQDGYRAIHENAAVGAIAPRLQLAVAGQDRATYLQGLLTNDIEALTPGTGCYALWLSPQGRTLTDMHVLASDGMILLDLPAETARPTLERLEQFIFSEDARVASLADSLSAAWLHGPRAAAVLGHVLGEDHAFATWPDYHHMPLVSGGHPVSVARIDQLGVPGYCAFLEPARETAFLAALQGAGAEIAPPGAIHAARIEAGYPVFGLDITDDTIPLEAGVEGRAISFSKGCYVGQEVIIRVLHRGQGRVARKLVGLRVEGPAPGHGAKLYAGEREIGFVTSSAESPSSGSVALGYVHRDFVEPGTSVDVESPSGREVAMVVDRPTRSAV
jgi:folate-binding protein YgfZ